MVSVTTPYLPEAGADGIRAGGRRLSNLEQEAMKQQLLQRATWAMFASQTPVE